MKELTIEQKAQRYDKIIEMLRSLHDDYDIVSTLIDIKEELENILPELKNEDERIRKSLINYVYCHGDGGDFTKKEFINWIKKQGEQNPVYTKEYDFHGIKYIPKFAKGDTIKDKKRGEVSTIKDFSYDAGLYTHTYGQFPITIQDNYELVEQKPVAWSEEDEEILNTIINHFKIDIECTDEDDIVRWLKSIKDRVQPQPKQEWGEEDCNRISSIKYLLHELDNYNFDNWLDSLKERYTWKPSNEQMIALQDAMNIVGILTITGSKINSLYQDLKKLKE